MMTFGIYKKGQGYWTRLMSAIALGTLMLMGGVWLSDNVQNVRLFGMEPIYTQALAYIVVALIFGWIGYHFIGRNRKSVDFLIATEGEMKKVNWSTPREIVGSTYLVIGVTIIIGIFCFCYDMIFQWIFTQAGVLET